MQSTSIRSFACALGCALASIVHAQSGVVDQISPYPGTGQTAGFNGDASGLIWQQEVRAGIAGQLEGFELLLNGSTGSQMNVRLRAGAGWNTSPVLYQTTVTQTGSSGQATSVFVDVTAANLSVVPGSLFVIEVQGNNTGCGFLGSYTPPPGTPQYAQFLFLNAPGCFADCGWRMAFTSYVLTGPPPPTTFCTSGTTSNGCTATISAANNPNVAHSAPCQINVSGVEGQKSGIIFYGLSQLPQPWCALGGGSSFLCVKPPTMRTLTQSTGGTSNACNGQLQLDWNAFQLANPSALGNPWTAGDKVYVQGWFRDPPACKTTSLSNAVELTYLP
ncbi:MAG: hypothetical protein IT454_15890 [Planctomycetes bacterium]|nr:hypothetical protein [Planctomycetota bacterium]